MHTRVVASVASSQHVMLQHAAHDCDAEPAREMVVTGTGRTQSGCAGAFPQGRHLPGRGQPAEALEQVRDFGSGQPVIPMPPVGLHGEEPRVGQLSEVAAGRRSADPGLVGQHAGGQCPSVVQGQQHLAARGVGEQAGQCRNVGVTRGG